MFFNSSAFLFLFLPVTLAGFLLLERFTPLVFRQSWLFIASLIFYGWSNPMALLALIPFVGVNYWIGKQLSQETFHHRKLLLWCGVALNLLILGYFKYSHFFVQNLNAVLQTHFMIPKVVLPLGISFIIFMQIAWLVASSKQKTTPCNGFEFCLYATFFPQIVAGPIVYQTETLSQFRLLRDAETRAVDLSIGCTLFVMGLCKKVLVADVIAPWGKQVFWGVAHDQPITFTAAWIGALAYSFQLYFDFSGYSDMAIGVARLFGIRLPLNFNSPYLATNISDFWRRWHMSLSRFLRDYLYISLGGNRCGAIRRSLNLFITMVLGGLWHGAGWPFLMWGALHGGYLVLNHAWTACWERFSTKESRSKQLGFGQWTGRLLTFFSVMIAWIFFNSDHFSDGWNLIQRLGGTQGFFTAGDKLFFRCVPTMKAFAEGFGLQVDGQILMLLFLGFLFVVVWFFPNSQQMLAFYHPAISTYGKDIQPHAWAKWGGLVWRPSVGWLIVTVLAFVWCLLNMTNVSSFLYRDF